MFKLKFKEIIKKITCIALLILMSVSFFACKEEREEEDKHYTPYGSFYRLGEAYDNGLLTRDEVRSIAYYQNRGLEYVGGNIFESGAFQPTDYIPIPKNPETPTTETQTKIIKDYLFPINAEYGYDYNENDASIKYFGTYNGCVAVMVNFGSYTTEVSGEGIDGIAIRYGSSQRIFVWKED